MRSQERRVVTELSATREGAMARDRSMGFCSSTGESKRKCLRVLCVLVNHLANNTSPERMPHGRTGRSRPCRHWPHLSAQTKNGKGEKSPPLETASSRGLNAPPCRHWPEATARRSAGQYPNFKDPQGKRLRLLVLLLATAHEEPLLYVRTVTLLYMAGVLGPWLASTNPTSPCATVAAGPATVAVVSEMKVSQQDVAARAQAWRGMGAETTSRFMTNRALSRGAKTNGVVYGAPGGSRHRLYHWCSGNAAANRPLRQPGGHKTAGSSRYYRVLFQRANVRMLRGSSLRRRRNRAKDCFASGSRSQ